MREESRLPSPYRPPLLLGWRQERVRITTSAPVVVVRTQAGKRDAEGGTRVHFPCTVSAQFEFGSPLCIPIPRLEQVFELLIHVTTSGTYGRASPDEKFELDTAYNGLESNGTEML